MEKMQNCLSNMLNSFKTRYATRHFVN